MLISHIDNSGAEAVFSSSFFSAAQAALLHYQPKRNTLLWPMQMKEFYYAFGLHSVIIALV